MTDGDYDGAAGGRGYCSIWRFSTNFEAMRCRNLQMEEKKKGEEDAQKDEQMYSVYLPKGKNRPEGPMLIDVA